MTAEARFRQDSTDREPIHLDREQIVKNFKEIKTKLKMKQIDERIEKEFVLNTQYTATRNVVPTKELPFTKVKNKNKVKFDQEWEDNNKKVVQMALEEVTREKIMNAFGKASYAQISTTKTVELVKEKMETLKRERGKVPEHNYVAPKKENVQSRYLNKDKRKRMNVENPSGRPIDFAFEMKKGVLGAATMRSDVPRTSYFQ